MKLIIENADRDTLEEIMRMVVGEFDEGINMKIIEDTVLLEHTTGQLLWGLNTDPEENAEPDEEPADITVELGLDKEDGAFNYDLLRQACLEDLHVKIEPAGSYPVTVPEMTPILVRADLDLNGSELYLTGKKLRGQMFQLFESGSICNGKLKGTFNGELEVYDGEMLLAVNEFSRNTTLIDNMVFSNCWGSAVGSGNDWRVETDCEGISLPWRSDETYQLITGYEFFGLFPVIKNNPIISEREGLVYNFFDKHDKCIDSQTLLPGIFAVVPKGAVGVRVYGVTNPHFLVRQSHFSSQYGTYIENCKFHSNHGFGIEPGCGRWIISNCESGENLGFCNVKNRPTAELVMTKCHSREESALLIDGAYSSILTDCSGNISFTGGFRSSVRAFKGDITLDPKSRKVVHLKDGIELAETEEVEKSPLVFWDGKRSI